jgi:uncharacterized membrane protein YdjX (TVP38/TMEM64 family)
MDACASSGMMTTPSKKSLWMGAGSLLVVVLVLVVALHQYFDLGQLLTLENLKNSRDSLVSAYAEQPLLTLLVFFSVYVVVTALSFPGALVLTLAAGAMFGLGVGLLVVSFASSLGALMAFLVARYLLRDLVQRRFKKALTPINEGMKKDGIFYLLTLRLVPVFPFWLINLLIDTDTRRAFLPCQPSGHAGGHGCLCECRHTTGRN